jgi:hypothetical protein
MKTAKNNKIPVKIPASPDADPASRKIADMAGIADCKKIPHHKILRSFQNDENVPMDLADLYRNKVLSQQTRTIRLLGRKCTAKIIHTLLGYEVQASFKRIQCPDLVTARYLKIFSELGCHAIKIPYDPTVTAALLPHFEAALDRILRGILDLFPHNRNMQNYTIRQVFKILRKQLQAVEISEAQTISPE